MRAQIIQDGHVARCDLCQSEANPTIELEELAELVHSALDEHFYMTSPDPEGIDYLAAKYGHWEQPGEPVTYAIMNLIASSEELAEAVRDYLSDRYDPSGKDAMIDPCPYAIDSQYEERPIDTYEFQESWASFRREILSRSRFFNPVAKSALEHLFRGIAQLVTYSGDPVVHVLGADDSIFRARLAKSSEALEDILKSAPRSLGSPPGRYASAGRMNAEGISVFYGATDVNTCIAEMRAPVGSYVVSGRFFPLRELRLLDLTRLRQVFLQGSLFDPEHTESLSRVHFLKRLEAELSQPVMPGLESRDYLPTQVVAEYLGTHPDMKLDGVMFASSQIAVEEGKGSDTGEEQQGRNVVLFPHARGLERYDIPTGTKIEVHRHLGDPDDPDHSIWIWERVPPSSEQGENASAIDRGFVLSPLVHPPKSSEDEVDVSIGLDLGSIEVRRIEGVSYQTFSFHVSRHRSESNDSDF
ncbi:RES domain-containing protein [Spiribacter halobius]|uniref:RES domain-containing protein n=1 Tax=Sediminicurvatus halobius TaxID=2182432 RepID=UPI001304C8F4|nr:RES domain-containing protein [Spiribacter halobius]UEX77723.1 RES domain-containing protein [Spiribacter halobius]